MEEQIIFVSRIVVFELKFQENVRKKTKYLLSKKDLEKH